MIANVGEDLMMAHAKESQFTEIGVSGEVFERMELDENKISAHPTSFEAP